MTQTNSPTINGFHRTTIKQYMFSVAYEHVDYGTDILNRVTLVDTTMVEFSIEDYEYEQLKTLASEVHEFMLAHDRISG